MNADGPTLTRRPEPLDRLRQRYAEAIREVVDVESAALGSVLRPGEQRKHVFDFEDGLRLIVSRDDPGDGKPVLHLSASVAPSAMLYGLIRAGHMTPTQFRRTAEARFEALSGRKAHLRFLGFSEGKGIPHWIEPSE